MMEQQMEPMVFGLLGEEPVRDPLRYTHCGLDNVYLCSGFKREKFGSKTYTSVKHLDSLYMLIALQLAILRRPLIAKEFAFLRKYLDKTQKELAKLFGVTRKTINTYEAGGRIPRLPQIVLQVAVLERLVQSLQEMGRVDPKILNQLKDEARDIMGWLLHVKEEFSDGDKPQMPSAFIADIVIGKWKVIPDFRGCR